MLVLMGLLTVLLSAPGCQRKEIYREFTFKKDEEGWKVDFADLPVDYDKDIYDLNFGIRDLPKELKLNKSGLMMSGHNRDDDLFMFIKRQFTQKDGVRAGESYLVTITMEFATNAPKGAVGIVGSPGESVYVKVGATTLEPAPIASDGYYQMNIDKGNQAGEGRDGFLIGDVAKEDGSSDSSYAIKSLDNIRQQLKVTADENGSFWVFIGTDSGFEGRTTIYFNFRCCWRG
jgi:hypothetical protein